MQKEIETEAWPTTVQIHGINAAGRESGNATICNGRTTPWLQDTSAAQVYQKWNVTYRDVIIVNELNQPVATYNLTSNNLGIPANYSALKALLQQAAGATDTVRRRRASPPPAP